MISTTLFGGLGNQMFIYAMVRAMSLRNRVSMAFNIKQGFKDDILYKRNLELNNFALQLPEAKIETFDIPYAKEFRWASRKLGFNILKPNNKFICEDANLHFQEELVSKKIKNAYLEGYWQSPKYFEDFEDIIRKDFNIAAELPFETIEELKYLKSKNQPLVMVGVRRYQEVKCKSFLTEHTCDAMYYKRAMDIVSQKIDNPLFVIFSQDREWVKDNLKGGYDVYIAKEKAGSLSTISDLYLMQNCDAAIISNSSFYWWGAWLSNSKTVISNRNFINKDCNCKEWLVI